MKFSSVTILTASTLLLAGCGLFHRSHPDAAASAPPALEGGGNETRYWDPQRNQWLAGAAATPKPKPISDPATADASAPAAPAPTPRASRATGVYNSTTGKIEWQAGGYNPPPAPTPAPAKHWWWPF